MLTVLVAFHMMEANVTWEFAGNYLFIPWRLPGCCPGRDLQAGLSCPGVDEVEARAAPIPWLFPGIQSLPGAGRGSGAESVAPARGKAWK